MRVLAGFLIATSSYLATAPLPNATWLQALNLPRPIRLKRSIPTPNFDQKLHFMYGAKSQLLAGVPHLAALQFALNRLPSQFLVTTRKAIDIGADASKAMSLDAQTNNFPELIEYAAIMEASSISGGSSTQAISELTNSMLKTKSFEQMLSTELASTKATVMVLAALPIIGAGLSLILGSHTLTWLLHSAGGRVCLVLGITMELLGWLWVKRLLFNALADSG
jgi:Flp pilus assembly protein TadB